MTSTLPSGDGTPDGAEPDGALEPDSAPATGLDPDTAPDAAASRTPAPPPQSDADRPRRRNGTPDVQRRAPGRHLLGDPALDNEQEMQQAGADLQSSREKSSTARDISDRLTAATRPETAEGDRS